MVMGNEPVDPNKQSNDKQNEDTVAKLLALAALAGLAWWARKRTQARQVTETQKTDPSAQHAENMSALNERQVAEPQKTDPFAQHIENMSTLNEMMRIQENNVRQYKPGGHW